MLRFQVFLLGVVLFLPARPHAEESRPVYLGLDGEFGVEQSTSAQAIERGILTAIDEINRAGGVLKGRPLQLVSKDNRSVTARGVKICKNLPGCPIWWRCSPAASVRSSSNMWNSRTS